MTSQWTSRRGLNRADSKEAPMTGEDRFAKVHAELDELLERDEISLEAFALYSAMADRLMTSANAL